MARGRQLYRLAAIILAAAGITMGVVSPASADTGSGGFTILYASSQQGAHKCNVIGDDGTYQAVVCSDLVTAENSTQYDVHGQAEAICQRSTTHVIVPCKSVNVVNSLATGNGSVSAAYGPGCGGDVPCPDGRYYVSTPNWVYNIANSAPACWSNPGSAYMQWDVVWGNGDYDTWIQTPDGSQYYLALAQLNDGANESTGHYYICP